MYQFFRVAAIVTSPVDEPEMVAQNPVTVLVQGPLYKWEDFTRPK